MGWTGCLLEIPSQMQPAVVRRRAAGQVRIGTCLRSQLQLQHMARGTMERKKRAGERERESEWERERDREREGERERATESERERERQRKEGPTKLQIGRTFSVRCLVMTYVSWLMFLAGKNRWQKTYWDSSELVKVPECNLQQWFDMIVILNHQTSYYLLVSYY